MCRCRVKFFRFTGSRGRNRIAAAYHLPLDGAQIALNGQEAENQFVGCNLWNHGSQISALGKKDHALLIDCRSLGTKAVSMPKGVVVVIINSNFKTYPRWQRIQHPS